MKIILWLVFLRKKIIQEQEDKLAALSEECIEPVMLEITFEANSNKIKTKDDAQLKVIATFLKENPSVKIKLIGKKSFYATCFCSLLFFCSFLFPVLQMLYWTFKFPKYLQELNFWGLGFNTFLLVFLSKP